MTKVRERTAVPPNRISQVLNSVWALHALRAAVEVNLFAQLQDGPRECAPVAGELDTDRRATEMLMDALSGLGFLKKDDGKYSLSDDARIYLLPTSDLFLGKYLKQNEIIDNAWRNLGSTLRSGRPAMAVNTDEKAQEFFPGLAEAIFPLSFAYAQKVSDDLKVSQLPPGSRVLDVAAGAGTWSIPMAIDNNSLRVDALDFPSILDVTKRFAEKYGVADRYGYIVGNWRNVAWQKEVYDLALLGHILHSEGAELSKQLLKRCFEALKPGGRIVVAEFITNNDHSGPPGATLFGVNMLMNTEIGCVFSEQELDQMLTKAGFDKVQRLAAPANAESMVVWASKPG